MGLRLDGCKTALYARAMGYDGVQVYALALIVTQPSRRI